jgi:hypothetical protein
MSAQKTQMRRAQVDAAENFLGKFCQSCCKKDEEVNVFKGVELQILLLRTPKDILAGSFRREILMARPILLLHSQASRKYGAFS